MKQLPKVAYSPEFRDEAFRLHLEDKLPINEIAKRLSLPRGTHKNWVAAARQGKLGEIGKCQKPLTEMEIELSKLRWELAEVKMERDLLKKCAAYPSASSGQVLRGHQREIWLDKEMVYRLPGIGFEPIFGGFVKWLPCLGYPSAVGTELRGRAPGG